MKTKLRKRVTEFMNKKSLEPMWISAIKDQNEITVQRFKELGNNGKVGFNSKTLHARTSARPSSPGYKFDVIFYQKSNRKILISDFLVNLGITFETDQRHQ